MAKVLTPAGLELSGKIGNLVVVHRGRGSFVRARVRPHNPQSAGQVRQRSYLAEAVAAWKALPEPERETYRKRGRWERRTGYHLFVAEWLVRRRGEDAEPP